MTPSQNRYWIRLRWLARDLFSHAAAHYVAHHGGAAKTEDLARMALASLAAAEQFEGAARAWNTNETDEPE